MSDAASDHSAGEPLTFKERLHNHYEVFKQSELFAITPTPRFEKRPRYGTTCGVVATAIVLGCAIAYAVVSLASLVRADKPSVTRTVENLAPAFPMDPFSLTLPHINDPSYFTALVEYRSQEPGQRSAKIQLDLVQGSGNLTYPGRTAGGSVAELDGDCRIARCRYVRVKIFPCQNGTTPGLVCQPFDVIDRVVNTNYMLLVVHGTSQDGDPMTRSSELSLKDALSFRSKFLFDVVYTKKYANLLTSFRTQKTRTLQGESPSFSIDRLPRLRVGDDTEYCKIDFMLSGVEVTERRRFATSLDVFANIGAFLSAFMGVVAVVVVAYNEHRFYTKYPKWGAFDGRFKMMTLSEEEQEADRLRQAKALEQEMEAQLDEQQRQQREREADPTYVNDDHQSENPILNCDGERALPPPGSRP